MRKTHGYRKPAMALVFVFLTGLVLAACSSSSSVDDALSHPGDRFLGTVTFKGGPGGLDVVEVSPAAQITQAEGFQVWTDGGSWNGVDTTTGDVVFKWLDTSSRLENVDIEIYDADAEGQDAYLNGDDVCGGATIAGCGTNPGYFYVSENAADGPETEIEYEGLTGLPRASRYLRAIPPKTTVKVPWSVVEPSGNQYQFYAMVMADKIPATTANDDPRYDPDTGTFTIQAYRLDPTTTKNPGVATDQPITSVKPGQWFYGVVWVDLPGADRPATGICADGGDGDSTCYTDINATNYDYYFVLVCRVTRATVLTTTPASPSWAEAPLSCSLILPYSRPTTTSWTATISSRPRMEQKCVLMTTRTLPTRWGCLQAVVPLRTIALFSAMSQTTIVRDPADARHARHLWRSHHTRQLGAGRLSCGQTRLSGHRQLRRRLQVVFGEQRQYNHLCGFRA